MISSFQVGKAMFDVWKKVLGHSKLGFRTKMVSAVVDDSKIGQQKNFCFSK
jgi:hypothetical protein